MVVEEKGRGGAGEEEEGCGAWLSSPPWQRHSRVFRALLTLLWPIWGRALAMMVMMMVMVVMRRRMRRMRMDRRRGTARALELDRREGRNNNNNNNHHKGEGKKGKVKGEKGGRSE